MLQVMASNHPGPTIPNLGPKWAWALMVQERVMGLWPIPPARIWGSGGISTGAFLPRSSQPPILPETCSTPGPRPGIRPRQKRPGRILGLEYGVEQFSAVSNACSTQAKMPGSSRNLPWLNSARPWSCCPVWYRCSLELFPIPIPLLTNLPPATLQRTQGPKGLKGPKDPNDPIRYERPHRSQDRDPSEGLLDLNCDQWDHGEHQSCGWQIC